MTAPLPYDLSILVRVRDECKALERLLSFIQKQKFNGRYEVIVIDNESSDDSAKIALSYGAGVFLLPRSLFTYGRAINIGIDRCRADLVLLLSAHVWPQQPDFLQSIVDDIQKRPAIQGIYFRQITNQPVGKAEKSRFSIFPKESCVIDNNSVVRQLNKGLNLYWASYFSNSACILRRDAVLNRPMRDLPYAEENAFALDLILQGKSVAYNNLPAVYYEGPVSLRRLYEQERRRTIAEKILENKYSAAFGARIPKLSPVLISVAKIVGLPVILFGIVGRFLFLNHYKIGSRPLIYDLCSLGSVWGRFVGLLSWKKFEKSFEFDADKLRDADKAVKQLSPAIM